MTRLPLLLEPDALESHLCGQGISIVDLSRRDIHQQYHVPGAVFLDYHQIVTARPPATGLLPDVEQIAATLSAAGISPVTHVVAYDDEGGGKAARLLWTLEVIGHPGGYSLLDGGLHAWIREKHALASGFSAPIPAIYTIQATSDDATADCGFILAHLRDPDVVLWDARTPDEYAGRVRYAQKAGHIPGARNLEWTEAMDRHRNLRLRPLPELKAALEELGITPGKTVVTYCQSHHRSAYTWFVLRLLGYRAKAYPGSWSEWGNRPDTPVEV